MMNAASLLQQRNFTDGLEHASILSREIFSFIPQMSDRCQRDYCVWCGAGVDNDCLVEAFLASGMDVKRFPFIILGPCDAYRFVMTCSTAAGIAARRQLGDEEESFLVSLNWLQEAVFEARRFLAEEQPFA